MTKVIEYKCQHHIPYRDACHKCGRISVEDADLLPLCPDCDDPLPCPVHGPHPQGKATEESKPK